MAENAKIVERKGSWYYYRKGGLTTTQNLLPNKSSTKDSPPVDDLTQLAQGRGGVIQLLKSDEALRCEIENKVKAFLHQVNHLARSEESASDASDGEDEEDGGPDGVDYESAVV
jgi:hypothetical protein